MSFLLLQLAFLASSAPLSAENQEIAVIFRYDDYNNDSPTDIETKMIQALKSQNLSATFAVIPFTAVQDQVPGETAVPAPLSVNKADILRAGIDAGVLEVAQHGYSHQSIREAADYDGPLFGEDFYGDTRTEFAGLDYERQVEIIAAGKSLLEETLEVEVSCFIPPFNTYDSNTTRALEDLGFECLSAGRTGIPIQSSKLKFVPNTCELRHLKMAIETARRTSGGTSLIVVLLHPFDFVEFDKERGRYSFEEFEEYLVWIDTQDDLRVITIKEAIESINDLNMARFESYYSFHVSSTFHLLPPILDFLPYPWLFYPSEDAIREIMLKHWLLLAVFYSAVLGIAAVTAYGGGVFLFSRHEGLRTGIKWGCLALLILLAVYAFRDLEFYYSGVIILTIIAGVTLGLWVLDKKLERTNDGS